MRELWCCVCLYIYPEDKRPEGWEQAPIVIIAGFSVCDEHVPYVPFMNEPAAKWRKENER